MSKRKKISLQKLILKFLIITFITLIILILSFATYQYVWIPYRLDVKANYNLKIHNRLERNSSATLSQIYTLLQFENQDLEQTKNDLESAREKNIELESLAKEYELAKSQLKTSDSEKLQNLNKTLVDSFEVKKNALNDFQEINLYLLCVGETIKDFQVFEEELIFAQEETSRILENNPENIEVIKAQLLQKVENLNQNLQKIKTCYKGPLSKYNDSDLAKLIFDTENFFVDFVNTVDSKNINIEIPLFSRRGIEVLSRPFLEIESSKKQVENSNNRIDKAISEWEGRIQVL